MSLNKNQTILMADDDPEDCELTAEALKMARIDNPVSFVKDGVELLEHLRKQAGEGAADKLPTLILLDLNMPRMNGMQALRELKKDPVLAEIPVVVLTTTRDEAEVAETYRLGAQSFITKPSSFSGFVDMLRDVAEYWFRTVVVPGSRR